MEYELLLLLASNPGRDFSRDDILAALRGIDAAILTRSVDILVSRLRAKLGDTSRPGRLIHTVWGRGYRFTGKPVARVIRLFSYSLSLRLLAIFLLLAALFAWGVVAGIRWAYSADDLRSLISGHLSLHVDYVRQDIGSPPRLDRALAITQRVPVDIHIDGPGVHWSSDPAFPTRPRCSSARATTSAPSPARCSTN